MLSHLAVNQVVIRHPPQKRLSEAIFAEEPNEYLHPTKRARIEAPSAEATAICFGTSGYRGSKLSPNQRFPPSCMPSQQAIPPHIHVNSQHVRKRPSSPSFLNSIPKRARAIPASTPPITHFFPPMRATLPPGNYHEYHSVVGYNDSPIQDGFTDPSLQRVVSPIEAQHGVTVPHKEPSEEYYPHQDTYRSRSFTSEYPNQVSPESHASRDSRKYHEQGFDARRGLLIPSPLYPPSRPCFAPLNPAMAAPRHHPPPPPTQAFPPVRDHRNERIQGGPQYYEEPYMTYHRQLQGSYHAPTPAQVFFAPPPQQQLLYQQGDPNKFHTTRTFNKYESRGEWRNREPMDHNRQEVRGLVADQALRSMGGIRRPESALGKLAQSHQGVGGYRYRKQ